MKHKTIVAFVCTHNACRSQIAEALGRQLAADAFISYSAGTQIKEALNPDAVRLVKAQCGIDMIAGGQHCKTLDEIPAPDWVITMGCGVRCPALPARHHEDWGLEDPTGKGDTAFLETIRLIREKILDLRERILQEENEEDRNG
ncbi:MAG: arsenate reductase ArsC [Lachnospiraceae bacterium]